MENLFIYHEKDILFLELIRIRTPDYQSLFILPQKGGEETLVSVFVTEARKNKSLIIDNEIQNDLEVRGDIIINNQTRVFKADCKERIPLTDKMTSPPKRKWLIEVY